MSDEPAIVVTLNAADGEWLRRHARSEAARLVTGRDTYLARRAADPDSAGRDAAIAWEGSRRAAASDVCATVEVGADHTPAQLAGFADIEVGFLDDQVARWEALALHGATVAVPAPVAVELMWQLTERIDSQFNGHEPIDYSDAAAAARVVAALCAAAATAGFDPREVPR